MYSLFRLLTRRELGYDQLGSLGVAWIVTEVFFKLGSFTFELAVFLALWFIFDLAVQSVKKLLRPGGDHDG